MTKRALLSVYDKAGIEPLASALHEAGYEIVSTGSTAAVIEKSGVPVTGVEQVTGFPQSFDGRVKTLHPKIHGGILALRDAHADQLAKLEITPIDVVVVNLYPFTQTVASGARPAEVIEQIDIGGPAMVRAAAKNFRYVTILTSPEQYGSLIEALPGGFSLNQRRELAAAAFAHTAKYDAAVAAWFAGQVAAAGGQVAAARGDNVEAGAGAVANAPQANEQADGPAAAALPETLSATWTLKQPLRYGENPHQQAALYAVAAAEGAGTGTGAGSGLANAELLSGKPMSFNNYQDAQAAIRAAYDFSDPTVAIVKHANPCGIAVAADVAAAHLEAHACDPLSAYGGVIAANREVSLKMAQQVKPIFTEVIAAPSFEPEALELLKTKKNLRIVRLAGGPQLGLDIRPIDGGALVQQSDTLDAPGDDPRNWQLVSGEAADEATLADLEFAWRAIRAVKSNAILLARGGATVGIGMGQVNRVDSCKLAVERANTLAGDEERARGAVAASDAFFPFADGLQILLDAGVKAVVQPGGSIRDDEVIAAAQAAGVTMYLTGARHFAH